MKKYKVRIFGRGRDAKAIIQFPCEPTNEMLENAVAEYLNEGLMRVEPDDFYDKDSHTILYEVI